MKKKIAIKKSVKDERLDIIRYPFKKSRMKWVLLKMSTGQNQKQPVFIGFKEIIRCFLLIFYFQQYWTFMQKNHNMIQPLRSWGYQKKFIKPTNTTSLKKNGFRKVFEKTKPHFYGKKLKTSMDAYRCIISISKLVVLF